MVTFGPTHNGRPSRRESGTAFYDGQCFVIEHGECAFDSLGVTNINRRTA